MDLRLDRASGSLVMGMEFDAGIVAQIVDESRKVGWKTKMVEDLGKPCFWEEFFAHISSIGNGI